VVAKARPHLFLYAGFRRSAIPIGSSVHSVFCRSEPIKHVGEELLDDPEIGSEFIQPLKMQGVVDVLQTALVVRCKFTATPIRPTYLQRQALRRLIDAFAVAGIRFAAPNVTVQLTSAAAG